MLLVLIPFMLGGNIYMLICESWRSQQLFQVSSLQGDTPACSHCCLSKGCWWRGGSAARFGMVFPGVLPCTLSSFSISSLALSSWTPPA